MEATINGFKLCYTTRGATDGLPLIFIHGFPLNKNMWAPQLQELPENIYSVAYDIRGHGKSEPGDGIYSIEFFVDDLFGLMDHLQIGKAVICGLSMGGYIALRAMEREPERFLGIILCDTKSEADPDSSKISRAAAIKYIRENGMQAYSEEFISSLFTAGSIANNSEAVKEAKRIIASNSAAGACATQIALASRTDTTGALSKIRVPALLLAGSEDIISTPKQMKIMQEKIAGAQIQIIPSAAHLSNMENPDAFNRCLFEFLGTHYENEKRG